MPSPLSLPSLVLLVSLVAAACPGADPAGPSDDAQLDASATSDVSGDTSGNDIGIDAVLSSDVDGGAEIPVDGTSELPDDAAAVDAGPVPQGPIGGDRPAVVTLPADYSAATSWPLVILLHGLSVNGFIQDSYLQFSAQATTLGFIAVVPDGTANPTGTQFWNAMAACCDFYGTGVDDEGYLRGLIAEAKTLWNVDADRVFFMGHSNGGYMSFRMVCNADEVAGIVSIAGSSYPTSEACKRTKPAKILQVHGSLDTTVSYLGTPFTPGAQTLVDRWAAHNNCTVGPVDEGTIDYDDFVPGAETTVSWHRGCDGGVEVGFFDMLGSGHIPTFNDSFITDALTWLLAEPAP